MLINLLSNARDASPPGGVIRVTSDVAEQTVYLTVEDEGSGIPKEIQDRLFEPFFTTRTRAKARAWASRWSIRSLKSIMARSISTARLTRKRNAAPVFASPCRGMSKRHTP